MDRRTTYAGATPSATDTLSVGQYSMVGLAKLSSGVLGTSTVVNGFTCIPTGPASLAVQLTGGEIYQMENLEQTTWSALPANTANTILKQGILLNSVTIGITPPGTGGFSQVFLIEVQYQDNDTNTQVLNYYNSANPNSPFYGPPVGGVGSGAAQSTVRQGLAAYQVKAGTPAATGTQTTPSADAGWTGLFTVTVANGQSTITSGNIAQLSSAPFIPITLPNVPAWVQAGSYAYGVDSGTANAIVATLSPIVTSYTAGLRVFVKKISSANSGPVTINLNGVGAVALVDFAGNALSSGVLPSGCLIECVCDGSVFRIVGSSASVSNTSGFTANSGDMVQVNTPNATVTITIATPGVVTWTAHGLAANTAVSFTTTGALPTGLSPSTTYYVLSPATNTFQVSATPGGAAINTSGSQSGVHTGYAGGAATVNLRTLLGTHNASIAAADRWPRGNSGDDKAYYATSTEVVNYLAGALPFCILNIQVFHSGGVYTPTAGARLALVAVQGAGGAGGGSSGGWASNGGAGETAYAYLSLNGVSTVTVTVGAGGTGVAGGAGNAGTASSFGSYASAGGGGGGLLGSAQAGGSGGSGGTGSGVFLRMRGQDGAPTAAGGGTLGTGGSCPFGFGGAPGEITYYGLPGNGYGSGGGGAIGGSNAGGKGGDGLVIVLEMT